MALTAAYQSDERSVSEVKKQPTDVYLLIACFLACRLFYQALPGKLIFRPFDSFPSPPPPQSCLPRAPAHIRSFVLRFGQVTLLDDIVNFMSDWLCYFIGQHSCIPITVDIQWESFSGINSYS